MTPHIPKTTSSTIPVLDLSWKADKNIEDPTYLYVALFALLALTFVTVKHYLLKDRKVMQLQDNPQTDTSPSKVAVSVSSAAAKTGLQPKKTPEPSKELDKMPPTDKGPKSKRTKKKGKGNNEWTLVKKGKAPSRSTPPQTAIRELTKTTHVEASNIPDPTALPIDPLVRKYRALRGVLYSKKVQQWPNKWGEAKAFFNEFFNLLKTHFSKNDEKSVESLIFQKAKQLSLMLEDPAAHPAKINPKDNPWNELDATLLSLNIPWIELHELSKLIVQVDEFKDKPDL